MLLRTPEGASATPSLVAQELNEIKNSCSSELKTGFFTNVSLLFKTNTYPAITGIGLLIFQ